MSVRPECCERMRIPEYSFELLEISLFDYRSIIPMGQIK